MVGRIIGRIIRTIIHGIIRRGTTGGVARRVAAATVLAALASGPMPAIAHGPDAHDHGAPAPGVARFPPSPDVPTLFGEELELPDTLGVGRVATDVAEHLPELEPLAAWLADRAGDLGFARARPVIARDNAEMIDFLRRGIVDIVSESPISALQLAEGSGASMLLLERSDGRINEASLLLVNREGPITSLSGLAGKRVVFEDPGATIGFALPLAAILSAGLRAVELAHPMYEPPPDGIGYFFSNSEYSIVSAVARGAADAGPISDQDWRRIGAGDDPLVRKLTPIWESKKVPRFVVLLGPAMTPHQREGIRQLLLHAADDGPGRAVLQRYHDVDHFDAIDSESAGEIGELRTIYASVRSEVH